MISAHFLIKKTLKKLPTQSTKIEEYSLTRCVLLLFLSFWFNQNLSQFFCFGRRMFPHFENAKLNLLSPWSETPTIVSRTFFLELNICSICLSISTLDTSSSSESLKIPFILTCTRYELHTTSPSAAFCIIFLSLSICFSASSNLNPLPENPELL